MFNMFSIFQKLLTAISRDFHNVYPSVTAFREVNLVLPETWSGSDCVGSSLTTYSTASTPSEPDFVIEANESPIFGVRPHSQTFGGCGMKGRNGVRLPFQLLNEKNVSRTSGKHQFEFLTPIKKTPQNLLDWINVFLM